MIIKKINFGFSDTPGPQPLENPIQGIMYVPEMIMTKAQFDSAWSGVSSLADLVGVLRNADADEAGFPYFWPGNYTGSTPLDQLTDYTTLHPAIPYSVAFNGTIVTGDMTAYVDDEGYGVKFPTGSTSLTVMRRDSYRYFNFGAYQLGWTPPGNASSAYAALMAVTSDGYVCFLRLYYNRNNSTKTWLSQSLSAEVIEWLRSLPDVSTDPYADAGDSEPGGGGGTFDYTGNPPGGFEDFEFPAISAVDTGFVTLYNPTMQQLKELSAYLWSNNFDLNTFKKLVNNPMDLFLGLSILPVAIESGGAQEVGIGMVGTGVYMTIAASQWASLDCGSVTLDLLAGSYLDFDPYTTIEIYLPYIGTRTLKADEVMGKTLSVHYAIDILSGACVAWLDIDGHVTYTYMGQCATSIPIVSGDWTNLINGILSVAGSAIGGAVKGGVGGAIAGGVAAASSVAVNDSKISVERAGNISSAGGLLAHPKPFIVASSPRICKPAAQNEFEGYPLYVTLQLSSASGFTQVEKIRLTGVPATDDELSEIVSLLKSGVIL